MPKEKQAVTHQSAETPEQCETVTDAYRLTLETLLQSK